VVKIRKMALWGVVSLSIVLGCLSCTQEQLAKIDQGVSDANAVAGQVGGLATGPTGALMPAWVRSLLEGLGIVGAAAVVMWQQLRNSGVLEKLASLTTTSKAIVRGVDNAAKTAPEAAAAVKGEVLAEMQRKDIELEGRQIVRDLKAS